MKRNPRIGLLPLYLKLYDDTMPERRAGFDPFLKQLRTAFEKRGVEVVPGEVCRVRPEFERAAALFDKRDVDCIVTLHLAYSPSEESAPVLTASRLPILMLDTTMDSAFGPTTEPSRIMFNHGIHGVMDLACMLRRNGKAYEIVAGHAGKKEVMDRAVSVVRGLAAARFLRETHALRIGAAFKGMGDFAVSEPVLRRVLGIRVKTISAGQVGTEARKVSSKEIETEMKADLKRYRRVASQESHERAVRVSLGLRRVLERGGYGAFSMNFLAFRGGAGSAETVPFLEASKAMARGIGYAGEGDVLTAALVGALARAFGKTTFTEIFCPDWRGNSLFLSHMGEINPDVAAAKPWLIEKPFPFTPAENPAVLVCAPRPGPATYVNLAPGPKDTFTLIVAPVEVLPDTKRADMKKSVRGWIRPVSRTVPNFLEAYSRAGGTHHSALVLGDRAEGLAAMGRALGMECRSIA